MADTLPPERQPDTIAYPLVTNHVQERPSIMHRHGAKLAFGVFIVIMGMLMFLSAKSIPSAAETVPPATVADRSAAIREEQKRLTPAVSEQTAALSGGAYVPPGPSAATEAITRANALAEAENRLPGLEPDYETARPGAGLAADEDARDLATRPSPAPQPAAGIGMLSRRHEAWVGGSASSASAPAVSPVPSDTTPTTSSPLASVDLTTPEGVQAALQLAETELAKAQAAAGASTATTPQQRSTAAPARQAPVTRRDVHAPTQSGLHRVPEGQVIEATLENTLDGTGKAPLIGKVRFPVYAQDGVQVIPMGATILGASEPVSAFGQNRLAVAFHRVRIGSKVVSLDQFSGMNLAGDVGLRGKVNYHYLSTFGASAALGFISGLANGIGNSVGSFSLGGNDGGPNIMVGGIGGVGTAMNQSLAATMNRLMNCLPTVTVPHSKRLLVYVTSDLDLPAYEGVRR